MCFTWYLCSNGEITLYQLKINMRKNNLMDSLSIYCSDSNGNLEYNETI